MLDNKNKKICAMCTLGNSLDTEQVKSSNLYAIQILDSDMNIQTSSAKTRKKGERVVYLYEKKKISILKNRYKGGR